MTSTEASSSSFPAGWTEFYSGDYEGYRVMGTWSACAGRYVLPGETVVIRDEFGYWRKEGPVTFLGRTTFGDYRYREIEGATRLMVWQVARGVCPVGCGCEHVGNAEADRVAAMALSEIASSEGSVG